MTRIGVLLSGRGSNFLAIHAAATAGLLGDGQVVLALTNIEGAPGIEKAEKLGLATRTIPHQGMKRRVHDALMVKALQEEKVEWVCLAGYMRLLTPVFVQAFPQRILNIHPSLLPAFPGLEAQEQAWEYGVTVSGCTVHLVDEGIDTGPIVTQAAVDIHDCADSTEVSERILRQEHGLYTSALRRLLSEEWEVRGRRVVFGASEK